MRVHHAVDIRPYLKDFGVDENLGVALVFPCDLLAVEIHLNDVLRTNLLKPEAVRLHENSLFAGNPHGYMTQNIVPVAFVSENVARQCQLFF
jgi:hypothetical protein